MKAKGVFQIEEIVRNDRQLKDQKRSGACQIQRDEYGNASWVPCTSVRASAVDRLLETKGLEIVDAPPPGARSGVIRKPGSGATGFDPYESGLLAKKEHRKKRDLRALSEWIKAKKRAESGEE